MIWLAPTTAPLVLEPDHVERWAELRAAAQAPRPTWLERLLRWCWRVVLKTMGRPG